MYNQCLLACWLKFLWYVYSVSMHLQFHFLYIRQLNKQLTWWTVLGGRCNEGKDLLDLQSIEGHIPALCGVLKVFASWPEIVYMLLFLSKKSFLIVFSFYAYLYLIESIMHVCMFLLPPKLALARTISILLYRILKVYSPPCRNQYVLFSYKISLSLLNFVFMPTFNFYIQWCMYVCFCLLHLNTSQIALARIWTQTTFEGNTFRPLGHMV